MSNVESIVEVYLKYMGVKYISMYLNELIQNNPISNTFKGIKDILLDYNIKSLDLFVGDQNIKEKKVLYAIYL